MTSASLLHLPDEVLLKILFYLHGTQRRYARQARHANALSLTCTRLRSLYSNTLQVLDAMHYGTALRYAPLPRCLDVARVLPFLTLAGSQLHVCKLPTLRVDDVRAVLQCIARCCPNVTQLAFTDKGGVDEVVIVQLFTACKSLNEVHVLAPSVSVLRALDMCTELKSVSLGGIAYELWPHLVEFLERTVHRLQLLHIALCENRVKTQVQHEHVPPVHELLNFLLSFVAGRLCSRPCVLEELRIDVSSALSTFQPYVAASNTDLYDVVQDIHSKINQTFEQQQEEHQHQQQPVVSCLKRLYVTAEDDFVFRALDALAVLIPFLQTLFVHVPGAVMQFVPDAGLEEGMHLMLRLVRIYNCYGSIADVFGNMQLQYLQTLDLGQACLVQRNCSTGANCRQLRNSLVAVAAQAGSNLQTLIATDSLKVAGRIAAYEQHISTVLNAAPSIRTLDVSFEIVFVAYDDSTWLGRIITAMRNITVLNLRSRYASNGSERSWMPMANKFVKGLPVFLEMLACNCRGLQVLYMETLGAYTGLGGDRIRWEDMQEAVSGLINFEYTLPEVDAGTVRAQLYCLQQAGCYGG